MVIFLDHSCNKDTAHFLSSQSNIMHLFFIQSVEYISQDSENFSPMKIPTSDEAVG